MKYLDDLILSTHAKFIFTASQIIMFLMEWSIASSTLNLMPCLAGLHLSRHCTTRFFVMPLWTVYWNRNCRLNFGIALFDHNDVVQNWIDSSRTGCRKRLMLNVYGGTCGNYWPWILATLYQANPWSSMHLSDVINSCLTSRRWTQLEIKETSERQTT